MISTIYCLISQAGSKEDNAKLLHQNRSNQKPEISCPDQARE
jgi:hypothetical protein